VEEEEEKKFYFGPLFSIPFIFRITLLAFHPQGQFLIQLMMIIVV